MASGMGSTAYSLYLKGPNQQNAIAQSAYEAELPADRDKPEAFAVGTNADDIVWPGMKIIRTIDGYAIGSGSASGDEGGDTGEEEATEE
jgi:hypothetical protein